MAKFVYIIALLHTITHTHKLNKNYKKNLELPIDSQQPTTNVNANSNANQIGTIAILITTTEQRSIQTTTIHSATVPTSPTTTTATSVITTTTTTPTTAAAKERMRDSLLWQTRRSLHLPSASNGAYMGPKDPRRSQAQVVSIGRRRFVAFHHICRYQSSVVFE